VQYSIKNLALFAASPAHKIDTNYRHQHNTNKHKLSKEFVPKTDTTAQLEKSSSSPRAASVSKKNHTLSAT
jgi:hypothetical protein